MEIYALRAAREYFLSLIRPRQDRYFVSKIRESPGPMPPSARLAAFTWAACEGGE